MKKTVIMIIMLLAVFVATLNQTVMSVAIPKFMSSMSITSSTAQWLTTGYMLVNGVFIPITAYLIRRFKTR